MSEQPTDEQEAVLAVIERHQRAHGVSPSVAEIADIAERLDTTVRRETAGLMGITPQAVSLAIGRIRVKIQNMVDAALALAPALEDAQDVLEL